MWKILILGWVLCCSGIAGAVEVPKEPVLRIETGAHLAPITRISADKAGQWAVTASEDKTVRLWNLLNGQHLAVLRPPIGPEKLGALYAAAISPNGRQVVAGGNSAFDGNAHALYLFDRATANLPPKSTLVGLEAPITELAWSSDSELVAVGLRQQGVRVFRRNLSFVGADPEFNDVVYGAAFAPDGRLAVASLDGAVRLYVVAQGQLQRVARKQLPGVPYGIAWSPDGRELVVGLQDRPSALILDADTLTPRHALEVGGAGNLGRVAWSADGRTIYAGGSASRAGRFAVFAFAERGRAAGREVASFGNIISALASHAQGVVASSAEPAWLALDAQAQPRFMQASPRGDFRDAGVAFRVSADAKSLVLPMTMGGRDVISFDLTQGELRPGDTAPNTQAPTLPAGLEQWRNSTQPRYRGQILPLQPGEVARSAVALAQGFALGSEWALRCFGTDGRLRWQSRTPGVVWAVNASQDGRWIVAALGDGSVRWYRSHDGLEQLALFVHADRERWIVWTPSGYYDTSMGGESLVGWHVNRAFNQASDFFSVGRFRERFYQPSVVQKLLELGDETAAVRAQQQELALLERMNAAEEAPPSRPVAPQPVAVRPSAPTPTPTPSASITAALPPVIELQSGQQIDSLAPEIALSYTVRSPDNAPLTAVKVRVNGKLERKVKLRSNRGVDGTVYESYIPVPPKNSEIVLIAENRHSKSEPVSVQVRRQAPEASAKSEAPPYLETYDTLYMLIVAINKYHGPNALQLPVKDAQDFRRQMTRVANPPPGKVKLYRNQEMRILVDEQATQENIHAGLQWLREKVGEKDAGVVFLAGHGISQDNAYYFIPYRPNDAGKQNDWLAGTEIVETLQNLPGRALFFLDTCYSGALANQARATSIINAMDEERGVIVFASSTSKEQSQETEEWGNGAFTKALIEGLRGEAQDTRDQLVYPSGLKRYVTRRVRDLTENQQRPYVSDHGIDDPIASVVQ
ncbi:MAG: caspase family protein [Giesbergeria sp.]|uniref:caspase family protein n=1 Tax=Giesbergeria sp. TaxID=2818473 RepID=UPI002616C6D6|nr:caspase family protein [Giesbergeria sp.]MDD2608773.1 caspase family protein [Giesbergeria sp.]